MSQLTHLDLFSGIGGFALAAHWAGYETIGFSEIDDYASKILKKHWPNVPNYGDVRNVPGRNVLGPVCLLTGGFPCQPFSCAGQRRGKDDDRHLWPAMFQVIERVRPAWVLAENVPGIIGMELESVCADLEAAGYEVAPPIVVGAVAVDAPHRRMRVWIVARDGADALSAGQRRNARQGEAEGHVGDSDSDSQPDGTLDAEVAELCGDAVQVASSERADTGTGQKRHRKLQEAVAHAKQQGPQGHAGNGKGERQPGREQTGQEQGLLAKGRLLRDVADPEEHDQWTGLREEEPGEEWRQRPCDGGEGDCWTWDTEPDVGRVAHGVPNRVDRLKGLGNAIVPQVAYTIIRAMIETELKFPHANTINDDQNVIKLEGDKIASGLSELDWRGGHFNKFAVPVKSGPINLAELRVKQHRK